MVPGSIMSGFAPRPSKNGLLTADQPVDERQLTQFIFASGFSTAAQVSEVAGRGAGYGCGQNRGHPPGHIEVHSQSGQGTRFRIFLPLTLAVTQALLVRSGNRIVALPSSMVEQVMELRPEVAEAIRTAGDGLAGCALSVVLSG